MRGSIWRQIWNYLRVRGEYFFPASIDTRSGELPPRARRIHPGVGGYHIVDRNYLRVRGEYIQQPALPPRTRELPPRARRIPTTIHNKNAKLGTTSACAENTIAL